MGGVRIDVRRLNEPTLAPAGTPQPDDGPASTLRTRAMASKLRSNAVLWRPDGFVRSMKSARHGEKLGQRLHAAESALALIRTLFGLQST